MARKHRAFVFVLHVVFSTTALPSHAQVRDYHPPVLFDISDEEMTLPLGYVTDVAVANEIVYILDWTSCSVRRITFDGEVLPPMGQEGGGPGDLRFPKNLTVFPDGRCVVLQSMSGRVGCFDASGDACEFQNMSGLRRKDRTVMWERAQATTDGDLLVAATTIPYSAGRKGERLDPETIIGRVWRFAPESPDPELLLSTSRDDSCYSVLRTTTFAWDINAAGELLFSAPGGKYGVVIMRPGSGEFSEVALPMRPDDASKIRAVISTFEQKVELEDINWAARVYWLDNDRFMVLTAAEMTIPWLEGSAGTYEVFSRDGNSMGRFRIAVPLNPRNDMFYINGPHLVVTRGSSAVARGIFAAYPIEGKPEPDPDDAEITEMRIIAYELFGKDDDSWR